MQEHVVIQGFILFLNEDQLLILDTTRTRLQISLVAYMQLLIYEITVMRPISLVHTVRPKLRETLLLSRNVSSVLLWRLYICWLHPVLMRYTFQVLNAAGSYFLLLNSIKA